MADCRLLLAVLGQFEVASLVAFLLAALLCLSMEGVFKARISLAVV